MDLSLTIFSFGVFAGELGRGGHFGLKLGDLAGSFWFWSSLWRGRGRNLYDFFGRGLS